MTESKLFPRSPYRMNAPQGRKISESDFRNARILRDGTVVQSERNIDTLGECDVLVVGGGPAGVTAAMAAARTGVRVILAEAAGYLGGLSTGGLVRSFRNVVLRFSRSEYWNEFRTNIRFSTSER